MKNQILFILCFALTLTSISAQNIRFGAKVGGNFATFGGERANSDLADIDPKFGLNFGAVASIKISNAFSIQPELYYSAQGYKNEVEGIKSKAMIDYFNVPILADLTLADGLSVQAGPQIGINIRKELEDDGLENTGSNLNVNDIEVAAAFGLQYKFDGNFFIHARYAMGLSEVFINDTAKSSVFSFSIGFLFDRIEDDYDD
jgi:hypothetical protein